MFQNHTPMPAWYNFTCNILCTPHYQSLSCAGICRYLLSGKRVLNRNSLSDSILSGFQWTQYKFKALLIESESRKSMIDFGKHLDICTLLKMIATLQSFSEPWIFDEFIFKACTLTVSNHGLPEKFAIPNFFSESDTWDASSEPQFQTCINAAKKGFEFIKWISYA